MTAQKSIRIAFASNSAATRALLRGTLAADPALSIVGESDNGNDLIALCLKTQPTIVLLDPHLPGPLAPTTIQTIRFYAPHAKIVIVSETPDYIYARAMARLPICGCILKSEISTHLMSATQTIVQGDSWYSPTFQSPSYLPAQSFPGTFHEHVR